LLNKEIVMLELPIKKVGYNELRMRNGMVVHSKGITYTVDVASCCEGLVGTLRIAIPCRDIHNPNQMRPDPTASCINYRGDEDVLSSLLPMLIMEDPIDMSGDWKKTVINALYFGAYHIISSHSTGCRVEQLGNVRCVCVSKDCELLKRLHVPPETTGAQLTLMQYKASAEHGVKFTPDDWEFVAALKDVPTMADSIDLWYVLSYEVLEPIQAKQLVENFTNIKQVLAKTYVNIPNTVELLKADASLFDVIAKYITYDSAMRIASGLERKYIPLVIEHIRANENLSNQQLIKLCEYCDRIDMIEFETLTVMEYQDLIKHADISAYVERLSSELLMEHLEWVKGEAYAAAIQVAKGKLSLDEWVDLILVSDKFAQHAPLSKFTTTHWANLAVRGCHEMWYAPENIRELLNCVVTEVAKLPSPEAYEYNDDE
jgi:hypothetical protein